MSAWLRTLPVLQGVLPVRRGRVPAEVLAGLTLAALGVPEVLGYAKIAGMPLVTGLYTMLLPMAAFAVLGSSRHLVVAADSATFRSAKLPIVTGIARPPGLVRSFSTIAADESIPSTLMPRAWSGKARRPVPIPSSRTRPLPASSASKATASSVSVGTSGSES